MDAMCLLENLEKMLNGNAVALESVARLHYRQYDQMTDEQRCLANVEACQWIRDCFEAAGWDWSSGEFVKLPRFKQAL